MIYVGIIICFLGLMVVQISAHNSQQKYWKLQDKFIEHLEDDKNNLLKAREDSNGEK